MTSTQLECFMLSAEHMNFTRAAEQLYITQPALSRNIAALEDELELLLFQRRNNVLEITPGAKMLYDWMRETQTGFHHVLEAARRANAESGQNLCIGFVRSEIPSNQAALALQRLKERQPELEFSFEHYHSRDIIDRLEEHRMDVAVMIHSATRGNPRLVTRTLGKVKRCVVVPISHPLAGRELVSVQDFRHDTFISVKSEVSVTLSNTVKNVCQHYGFTPILLEADSTEEQLQWIVSGKGVGLLVENHVKRYNPLFVFLDLEEEMYVDVVCTWDRLNTNPHIQQFLDAFEE